MKNLILVEEVGSKIFLIRGHKVMLSTHLAMLYGVGSKVLLQSVKRNIERFPEDFMFQLTWDEAESLRSQIGVELINSVDDVCHYRLIYDAS